MMPITPWPGQPFMVGRVFGGVVGMLLIIRPFKDSHLVARF